jgi:hypothetical protein
MDPSILSRSGSRLARMKTDKELAMQLVDSLEEYCPRCTLLETILDTAKVPGWRQSFKEIFPFRQLGRVRGDDISQFATAFLTLLI